jgi:hypothetical protein
MEEKNEDIETSENNEEETSEDTQEETSEDTQEETSEDTQDGDETPTLEDFEKAQAKLKELEEKNKQLYARVKKQEAKPLKTKEETLELDENLIRVARLASTLDDDDLEVLKTLNGSINEKLENPAFKAYKEAKDKKVRSQKASLGTSTSGQYSSKDNPNKPGLSPEEHRKIVEKMMQG